MWPRFLRVFGNTFVVAYAVDAGISVVHALVRIAMGVSDGFESPVPLLGTLQATVAGWVIFLALLALPLLGFSRRLAPSVFGPLVLSTLWFATGAMPFLFLVEFPVLVRFLSACQLGVACAVFLRIRTLRGGAGWLFDDDWFARPDFSKRYLAVYGILATIGLSVFVLLGSVAGVLKGIEVATNGFIRIDATGLALADRTYLLEVDPLATERSGTPQREIRLVGMMHVGSEEAYQTLFSDLGRASPVTVVLTEGVSDSEGKLEQGFSYDGLAEFLGVQEQQPIETYLDRETLEDGTSPEGATLINADLDLSEFDPATVAWLQSVGTLYSGESFMAGFLEIYRDLQANPEQMVAINNDIIVRRNQNLITWIKASRENYLEIVVPWGALHLPVVEAAVLEMGFELRESGYVPLLSWQQLREAFL